MRSRVTGRAVWLLPVLAVAMLVWSTVPQLGWQDLPRLRGWAAAHPGLAEMAYCGVYAGVVGASLPAGGVLTLAGGALFGAWRGSALAVLGASAGAVLLFLLARFTLGRGLAVRAGPLLERVRPALERDGFWGLLALRLAPVVPFWLGNLAPALLGMRLLPFAAATVIGIIPATSVLASLGAGLAEAPTAAALLTPQWVWPLLGLALLSLLPVAWRRWQARHAA